MSELQKFENSEKWRNKLRNYLLRDQPQVTQSKGFDFKETNRYSFDIKEDLKNLIEKQKKQKMTEKLPKNMANCENKENENCNSVAYNFEKVNMNDVKQKNSQIADDSILDLDRNGARKDDISDESFEVMELMCNKSASDPDSTLFQYLHTEKKRNVLEMKKRRSGYESLQSVKEDPEHMTFNSLLNNLKIKEEQKLTNDSPLEGAEMTQIEDIEAPSRMWDNDTILQTSPVKMVGLLRPSTIFECAEISDVSSAQASFKSAPTELFSEGSGCYETASDTMLTYNQNKETHEIDGHTSVDLIDLEKTMQIKEVKEEPNEKIKIEKLIDLTIDTNYNNHSIDSEDSVIELLSDDEQSEEQQELVEEQQHTSVALIKFEDANVSSLAASNNCTLQNSVCDQDILSTSSTNNNQSLHFNDTLEEVEYMMQKGLEFMAGAVAGTTPKPSPFKPKTLPSPKLLQKERTFTVPLKQMDGITPKNYGITTHPASQAQKSASKYENRFVLDIKPFPKLDLFKKPLSPQKTAGKPVSRPKDKFDHVISPIAMYIKKTAEVPLMSEFKKINNKDSSVFRALDFESCQHKPHLSDAKAEMPKSLMPCSLPKKAYISSEFRQVTDGRNTVTIPGSKCIQKHLDSALLPAVIKHDGKMNLASDSVEASKSPLRTHAFGDTDSFANLSLITGDVSIYTIKDAKKLK